MCDQEFSFVMCEIFILFGITSTTKYLIIRHLLTVGLITKNDFEKCVNNELEINKLVKSFVQDGKQKVPEFRIKHVGDKDEFMNFIMNTEPGYYSFFHFKYTTNAHKVLNERS